MTQNHFLPCSTESSDGCSIRGHIFACRGSRWYDGLWFVLLCGFHDLFPVRKARHPLTSGHHGNHAIRDCLSLEKHGNPRYHFLLLHGLCFCFLATCHTQGQLQVSPNSTCNWIELGFARHYREKILAFLTQNLSCDCSLLQPLPQTRGSGVQRSEHVACKLAATPDEQPLANVAGGTTSLFRAIAGHPGKARVLPHNRLVQEFFFAPKAQVLLLILFC